MNYIFKLWHCYHIVINHATRRTDRHTHRRAVRHCHWHLNERNWIWDFNTIQTITLKCQQSKIYWRGKMKVPHFYIPTYMHTYIHFDVCYFIVLQSIGNSYFHLKFLWPPFFVCVWNRRYSFFGNFFWFRFDCGFSDIKENVNIISSLCLKSIVLRSHIYVSHWIVYIYFFSCLI